MAKDPRTILSEAASLFITENAGAWASSVVPYVPGLVEAQLVLLASHGLYITVKLPATPPK